MKKLLSLKLGAGGLEAWLELFGTADGRYDIISSFPEGEGSKATCEAVVQSRNIDEPLTELLEVLSRYTADGWEYLTFVFDSDSKAAKRWPVIFRMGLGNATPQICLSAWDEVEEGGWMDVMALA